MQINNGGNLSASEKLAKSYQAPVEINSRQNQQAELVSSQASQASRAYATPQIIKSRNVNFEGKYEKLMDAIKTTTNPSKIHLNFEEALAIFERLGFKVKQGKGSHCTVDLPGKRPLTVVRPHGRHDYIHPETIKNIRALLLEK